MGTDQLYTLASWSKPNMIIIADRDPLVQLTHMLYISFFQAAKNNKEFMVLWRSRGLAFKAIKNALIPLNTPVEALKQHYLAVQLNIMERLQWLEQSHTCFLNNPDAFQHIHHLACQQAIVPLSIDLTDNNACEALSTTLKQKGQSASVLYLSNLLEYQGSKTQGFVDNIKSLPFSTDSQVLYTTLKGLGNATFDYISKPPALFVAMLETSNG